MMNSESELRNPNSTATGTDRHDACTFLHFSDVMHRIEQTVSIPGKVTLFAAFLKSLKRDTDLALALRFSGNHTLFPDSGKKPGPGSLTAAMVTCEFCEIDYKKVFKPCRRATGSSVETIEKLLSYMPVAASKRRIHCNSMLTLPDISDISCEIAASRKTEDKKRILLRCMSNMTAREFRNLLHLLGLETGRNGMNLSQTILSVSEAFGVDPDKLCRTFMLTGCMHSTALLARHNKLNTARFQMHHMIPFMLPETVSQGDELPNDKVQWIAEVIPDGLRCQLHVTPGKTTLISGEKKDITNTFPEITAGISDAMPAGNYVLEGMVCAFKNSSVLPYHHLQRRLEIRKPKPEEVFKHPARFFASDLLILDDQIVLDEPLTHRRKLLTDICHKVNLSATRSLTISSLSEPALKLGSKPTPAGKGIMLKYPDSTYEFGKQSCSWKFFEKKAGSVNAVILYAKTGTEALLQTYSEFTLGIRVDDDDRFEESFVPIGTIKKGIPDSELQSLTETLRNNVIERFGPVRSFRPEVVVTVTFENIRINRRSKAGVSLLKPQWTSLRPDLSASECHTLKELEEMMY